MDFGSSFCVGRRRFTTEVLLLVITCNINKLHAKSQQN